MTQGKIVDVTARTVGAEVAVSSTGTTITVLDGSPFDPTGGSVNIDGTTMGYVSAATDVGSPDDEVQVDTITLVDPVTVTAGDWIDLDPIRTVTTATVRLWDDAEPVPAIVPHELKSRISLGVRENPAEAETVEVEWDGGAPVLTAVHGQDGAQTWGNPLGEGLDVGDGGVVARGTIVADSVAVNGDITVAGVPLVGGLLDEATSGPGWLDRLGAGIVARQTFSVETSYRPAGEEWGYAAVSATMRAGRLYRVGAYVRASCDIVSGVTQCRLRVGPNADLTATEEALTDLTPVTSTTHRAASYMWGLVGYSSDTSVDALVTYRGIGGARSRMSAAEIFIEDVGPQGTYGGGSYRAIAPGGTTDPAPPPPPPSTVREYTSVWRATNSGTYTQGGSRRTVSDLVVGYIGASSSYGHQQSLILFGPSSAMSGETSLSMNAALTGAMVTKVEIWLYADHWYNSVGGVARLGKWSSSDSVPTMPNTLNASPSLSAPSSGTWRRDQGRWVTIPNWWISDGTRGITLGGGSSRASAYYGRFAGVTSTRPQAYWPRIRVTYTR